MDLADTLGFVEALDMYCAYHFRREDDLRDAARIVTNGYEPCSSTVKVGCGAWQRQKGGDTGGGESSVAATEYPLTS